jgi:lipopolysaccharide/colanic/teichoic acid biosynthesis glycosyltransferase
MYKLFFKRIIDLVLSFILILILLPVFLLFSLLIKITSKGPIFFVQKRIGKDAKLFSIIKFRSMTNKERKVNQTLNSDPEVTVIGRFMRRYKIDELPQILNVLIGDMSIVGPRPAFSEQLKNYNDIAKCRLKVKPGLTGLSQVNGNIYLSWEERWNFDKKYVEEYCFKLDMCILFKTFKVVLFGEDKFLRR